MARRTYTLDTIKTPPFYSHAVSAGGLVFVSGIGAFDENGTIVGDTIERQTARAAEHL